MVKVKVDAFSKEGLQSNKNWSCYFRDDEGRVLHAWAKQITGFFSPHLAECLTAREGVSLACFFSAIADGYLRSWTPLTF